MDETKAPGNNSAFLIVELVGPAGSGKSAIVSELGNDLKKAFGYVGRPRPTVPQRLIAALEALPTLLSPYALPIHQRLRLFNAHRAIRASIRWIQRLPPGIHVIDEGPHRIIHDQACVSEKQLDLWRRIVCQQLIHLSDIPTLVVRVQAPPEMRRERRESRMSALEYRDPNFNKSLPPRARPLLFIRDELKNISPEHSAFRTMVAIKNEKSLKYATRKLFVLVRMLPIINKRHV